MGWFENIGRQADVGAAAAALFRGGGQLPVMIVGLEVLLGTDTEIITQGIMKGGMITEFVITLRRQGGALPPRDVTGLPPRGDLLPLGAEDRPRLHGIERLPLDVSPRCLTERPPQWGRGKDEGKANRSQPQHSHQIHLVVTIQMILTRIVMMAGRPPQGRS